MQFRHSLDTVVAPEAAFAYVVDFAHISDWDPGVASSRALAPGAVGVGSEFDLMVRFAGLRVPYRYRVVEHEPPRRAVLMGESRRSRALDTIELEPTESGTRITWTGEVELRGATRALAPLFRPMFDAAGRRALAGLQKRLDASATL